MIRKINFRDKSPCGSYLIPVVLVFLVSMSSCKKTTDFSVPVDSLTVNENSIQETLQLMSEAQDISLISLDKSDSVIIGYVQALNIVDSTIVLFDNQIHQILLYNMDGRLKKVIASSGGGPEEFEFLECFFVDEQTKEIVIFDSRHFKFLHFSLGGDFLREKKVNFFARDIIKVKDKWFINNAWSDDPSNPYQIIVTDESYNVLSYLRKQDKPVISTFANSSPFREVADGILYQEALEDTVFMLDDLNLKLRPKFRIDFGKYNYPSEIIGIQSAREFIKQIKNGDYKGWVRDLYTNGQTTLFQFHDSRNSIALNNVICRSDSSELDLYAKMSLEDLNVSYPKAKVRDRFYSIISPEFLDEGADKSMPNTLKPLFTGNQGDLSQYMIVSFRF